MKILVPTDFSESANQALEYGAEIAKATQSQLTLLHVYSGQAQLSSKLDTVQALAVICQTISAEYDSIACVPVTRAGEVVDEILAEADDIGADFIVMATNGATNLGRLVFGSNTASVIEKAKCPVLSVPGTHTFRKPEKMLFATTFAREEMHAAIKFTGLGKVFDATVIIAHVSLDHEREEVEASMSQTFANELEQKTNYNKIVTRNASENTVTLGLDTLIIETGADIIALSTRRRSIFEKMYNPSITRKYSLQADIPLMAFHADLKSDASESVL